MKKIMLASTCLCLLSATLVTKQHKIFVIGDSTACNYESSKFPRTGWAQVLQDLFENVTVINKARSGRSSKSYFEESGSYWPDVKKSLSNGDYLIIQFGHNDEKTSDKERGTNPGSTFEHYLSIYIDAAIAKGALPILVTPIERNGWSSDTKVKPSHKNYPEAMRTLAREKGVPLVDLTVLTTAYYEKIGKESTTNKIFLNLDKGVYPNYKNGNTDNTHLQFNGAKEVARLFVDDIVKQRITPIASWVKGATETTSHRPKNKIAYQSLKPLITRNSTTSITLSFDIPVVSFSLFDCNGRLMNYTSSINKNQIYLQAKNGSRIKSGNYFITCTSRDGSENHAQFTIQ